MIIDTKLARAFNEAVTNVDNIHMGTQEGEINWNFVDADCYMAMTAGNPLFNTEEEGRDYIAQFDYLADVWEGKYTVHQVRQNRIQIMPVTNADLILDPTKPAYLVRVK